MRGGKQEMGGVGEVGRKERDGEGGRKTGRIPWCLVDFIILHVINFTSSHSDSFSYVSQYLRFHILQFCWFCLLIALARSSSKMLNIISDRGRFSNIFSRLQVDTLSN